MSTTMNLSVLALSALLISGTITGCTSETLDCPACPEGKVCNTETGLCETQEKPPSCGPHTSGDLGSGDCRCLAGWNDCNQDLNETGSDGCECDQTCDGDKCAEGATCAADEEFSCTGDTRFCSKERCSSCPGGDNSYNCDGLGECESATPCSAETCESRSWFKEAVEPGEPLTAVWGSDPSNIIAVGAEGVIMRYNGTKYDIKKETSAYLFGVWGSGPDDVFVVGENGTIWHFDGSGWAPMTSGTEAELRAVWGDGSDKVYAAGMNGTVLFFNGTDWSELTSGTEEALVAIWGSSGDDLYFAGENGTLLHYKGGQWTSINTGTVESLEGIWGSGPDNIYVVGSGGVILHSSDGASFENMTPGEDRLLFGIDGNSAGQVIAVGEDGLVLEYKDSSWQTISTDSSTMLMGVWVSDTGDILCAGLDELLHYRCD